MSAPRSHSLSVCPRLSLSFSICQFISLSISLSLSIYMSLGPLSEAFSLSVCISTKLPNVWN